MGQFDSIFVDYFDSLCRSAWPDLRKRVQVTSCKWVKIGTSPWLIYRVCLFRKKNFQCSASAECAVAQLIPIEITLFYSYLVQRYQEALIDHVNITNTACYCRFNSESVFQLCPLHDAHWGFKKINKKYNK